MFCFVFCFSTARGSIKVLPQKYKCSTYLFFFHLENKRISYEHIVNIELGLTFHRQMETEKMREEGRGGGRRQEHGKRHLSTEEEKMERSLGRKAARCKEVQRPELKETFLARPSRPLSCRHSFGGTAASESE